MRRSLFFRDGIFVGSTIDDRPSQGDLVGIFQFITNGDTTGQCGDLKRKFTELTIQVKIGGIAFHGGTERQNEFGYFTVRDFLFQYMDVQIIRANTIDGGYDATQNMVDAAELMGVFDGHDIPDVFHHTHKRMIAGGIGADTAHFGIGNIIAARAIPDVLFELDEGLSEMFYRISLLPEQVEYETKGGFPPDARETGKLIYRFFQQFRWELFNHNAMAKSESKSTIPPLLMQFFLLNCFCYSCSVKSNYMSPLLVFGVIAGYFSLLIIISVFTSRNSSNETFFTGNKQSPWFVVAFGMIGASLSGVTFISIPGEVGAMISQNEPTYKAFSYFQLVLGYLLGYFVIANVLMPLYYRLNLISIYTYLDQRFGFRTYKTGSLFFLLSQTMGASLRLFLVAGVLQIAFFDAYNIPFVVTVTVTILLIWAYTFRAGIKTIVWTDTLQTLFMLLAVVVTIVIISKELNLSLGGMVSLIEEHEYSKIFFWDWKSSKFFFKQFFSGAFIAIVMTGLDQNMMQKNLTCRNIGEAKKNMYWFSGILVPVNFLFLSLGLLLYVFAIREGIALPERSDDLFPILALRHFSYFVGIVFLLGITSAAFSSADSALTALTTAFCVDFLNLNGKTEKAQKNTRLKVHIGFSMVMFLVIVLFRIINDESVITAVFTVAGYTYGPLLGLFSFGLFTKYSVKDKWVPVVAVLSPIITYFISSNSAVWFNGYIFGFELLILNGLLTFTGLLLLRQKNGHAS